MQMELNLQKINENFSSVDDCAQQHEAQVQ
jgi:hypothetical protein